MKSTMPILLLMVIMLASCKKGHMQDHKHGSANEYMHRSSTENLISHFESSERDEYQKPEKVIEFLGEIKGKKIMDLGAGSGYFSFRLAAAGATVIAADVNDEFQQHIRERLDAYQPGTIEMELRKLPYDSPKLKREEVDMVLVVNTYHHIEDRVDYFKQVLNGLVPGGQLVVIDYFKKSIPVGPPSGHKLKRDVVIEELDRAGFSDINVNLDLLPYQYVIVANRTL